MAEEEIRPNETRAAAIRLREPASVAATATTAIIDPSWRLCPRP